jgi:hypothetical protein
MRWYVFQGLIMFGVISSNIHWHWTHNPYLAAICGWLLTYLATCALLGWRQREPQKPQAPAAGRSSAKF